MRTAHKITFTTIATVIGIAAGIVSFINNSIQIVQRATASEVPDNKNLDTTRTIAGNANLQFENVQLKPKGAK